MLRQLRDRGGDRCAVEHCDSGMMREECRGEVDLGAGRTHLVQRVGDLLQRREELGVLGEGEQRLARERKAAERIARGQRGCRLMHWGAGGRDCHD